MRRQAEDNLRQMNESLKHLDEKYQASLVQVPEMKEQLKAVSQEHDRAAEQVNVLHERQNSLKFALRDPQQTAQDIQGELNKIKDSRRAFCNKIQGSRQGKDAARAMEWIQQNKHRFKGECYGPVGAEVDVKTQADAAMLESVVSFPKLITFLVDSREDEHLLESELRGRMRLSINITTMNNKTCPPQPLSREYLQRAKTEYGFEGFLGDKCKSVVCINCCLNLLCCNLAVCSLLTLGVMLFLSCCFDIVLTIITPANNCSMKWIACHAS